MSSLTGSTISSTYQSLLKIDGNNTLSATLRNITDGVGNITPISISTTLLNISTAFKLSSYGTGTRTGTATYNLAVDATGNVIEVLGGGGGGTTINPTNDFIPVRSNGTTFVDSNIFNTKSGGTDYLFMNIDNVQNTILVGSNRNDFHGFQYFYDIGTNTEWTYFGNLANGFSLNYAMDWNNFSNSNFSLNAFSSSIYGDSSLIKTLYNGNPIGLLLDFNGNNYALGDFTGNNVGQISLQIVPNQLNFTDVYTGNNFFTINNINSTGNINFTIDVDNSFIATSNNGTYSGINLDFSNNAYSLGDYNATSNITYVEVDDANQQIKFKANTKLVFQGTNLLDANTYTYSDKNLVIEAPDGGTYYIPLYS